MAKLITPFNAHDFNPEQSAGQLPIGKHPVVIESSEVKANKANDGGYLQLNLKVIEGPNAGVTGPYRLNLYHSDQTTCDIANRQLSAVCHVTGVFNIDDSSALHNIPFIVEVSPQTKDPKYTQVTKVFDINGNEPSKGGNGQQQNNQSANNNGGWGNTGTNNAGNNNNQQSNEQSQPQNTGWGNQNNNQNNANTGNTGGNNNNNGGGWTQNAGSGGKPSWSN